MESSSNARWHEYDWAVSLHAGEEDSDQLWKLRRCPKRPTSLVARNAFPDTLHYRTVVWWMQQLRLIGDNGKRWSDKLSPAQVNAMLASTSSRKKLVAMKVLVSLMARGVDVSDHFAQVVQLVASASNAELKKLVFLFIQRYAYSNQELVLLTINSFHQDLKARNERTRAHALRAMSCLQVPVILPLQVMAVQNALKDSSVYVRRTAALAILKLAKFDASVKETFLEALRKLLAERSFLVFPVGVLILMQVYSDDAYLELLHPHFRFFCQVLSDLDASSQTIVIEAMIRYARKFLPDPSRSREEVKSDDPEEELRMQAVRQDLDSHDDDYQLMLKSCSLMLMSISPSVVLSISKLFFYCASKKDFDLYQVASALVRTMLVTKDSQCLEILFENACPMVVAHPESFVSHFKAFLVSNSDSRSIQTAKFHCLAALSRLPEAESFVLVVLQELEAYLSSQDIELVSASIQLIGSIGSSTSSKIVAEKFASVLMRILRKARKESSVRTQTLVGESVIALRYILQAHFHLHDGIIPRLVGLLDSIPISQKDDACSNARSAIIWLIGEYRTNVSKYLPDVLRKLAKEFRNESGNTKLQIMNLALKLRLQGTEPQVTITKLVSYILELARFDMDIDIRDKSRMFGSFLRDLELNSQMGKLLEAKILADRPVAALPSVSNSVANLSLFNIGTISYSIHQFSGPSYRPLPECSSSLPNASIRDPLKSTAVLPRAPSPGSSLGSIRVPPVTGSVVKDLWSSDEDEKSLDLEEAARDDQSPEEEQQDWTDESHDEEDEENLMSSLGF